MLTGSNVIRAHVLFEMRDMYEKESDEFTSMNEWMNRWMDELKPVRGMKDTERERSGRMKSAEKGAEGDGVQENEQEHTIELLHLHYK